MILKNSFVPAYFVPFKTVVQNRHPQLQERLQEQATILSKIWLNTTGCSSTWTLIICHYIELAHLQAHIENRSGIKDLSNENKSFSQWFYFLNWHELFYWFPSWRIWPWLDWPEYENLWQPSSMSATFHFESGGRMQVTHKWPKTYRYIEGAFFTATPSGWPQYRHGYSMEESFWQSFPALPSVLYKTQGRFAWRLTED